MPLWNFETNQKHTLMKKAIVLFIMLTGFGVAAFAQKPGIVASDKAGWHKIGEVKANFKAESDAIVPMGKDTFKAVKLKVTDAPIDINQVIVTYEDETMQKIPVDGALAAGAETQSFDLASPEKEIKKVSFTYKSQPNYQGDRAHVELYGLK
jgi:hypothetical protein